MLSGTALWDGAERQAEREHQIVIVQAMAAGET